MGSEKQRKVFEISGALSYIDSKILHFTELKENALRTLRKRHGVTNTEEVKELLDELTSEVNVLEKKRDKREKQIADMIRKVKEQVE